MPYERCRDVAENFWQELQQADPEEVVARTGAVYGQGRYLLPFFESDPGHRSGPIRRTDDGTRRRSRVSSLSDGAPLPAAPQPGPSGIGHQPSGADRRATFCGPPWR